MARLIYMSIMSLDGSRPAPSGRAWSTTTTWSSRRSCWAAARRPSPRDARLPLELVGKRRFGSGVVHLHYRDASRS
ncbi:MAG: hypothetical protein ABR926_07775 [Streptosporangiaceae bacterium]